MSQNLTGSATVQASKAVVNSLTYKNENISESIQPEMVKRTTLHPVYNDNDEIEERIYYTLHNDAATCTYVSPHIKFEKSNNIISTIPGEISKSEKNENDIPIIPVPPPPGPPPPQPPPNPEPGEDEEGGGWPTGGGTIVGGDDDDDDTPSSSGPRTNFDNYAAEVAGPFGKHGIDSTRDVVRWYKNRSAMTTAKFAMAKTRSRYNSIGCDLNESYANLESADDMYFNSYIEKGRFAIPKVTHAPRMFKDAIYLEDLTLNRAKSLINAESMCENCYNLEHAAIKDNHQLSNATAMFKNCIALQDVSFSATNGLTTIDHMFEGCKSPAVSPFDFPVVDSAKYALSKTTYKTAELKFPELRDASYMMYNCKKLTTVQPTSNLEKLQKAEGMFKGCVVLQSDNTPIYSSLTDATEMYNGCTSLVSIAGRYPVLQSGKELFKDCTALQDVDIQFKFPSLVDGTDMFRNCKSINNVAFSAQYLTTADNMFKNCSGAFLINVTADSLETGESMFEKTMPMDSLTFNAPNATNLNRAFYSAGSGSFATTDGNAGSFNTSFDANLTVNPVTAREMFKNSCILNFNNTHEWSRLSDATSMFENCLFLTSINFGEAPLLTTIDGMFKDCSSLTTVNANFLSVVNYGVPPFENCPRLKNVTLTMNNLTDAEAMFRGCAELESVNGSFENLVGAKNMFRECVNLKSGPSTPAVESALGMYQDTQISELPSLPFLKVGRQTFQNCQNIPEHIDCSAWPELQNGINMFNSCKGITSVSLNLPKATDIRNMFALCPNITYISGASFAEGVIATSVLMHAKVDISSFMTVYNAIKDVNPASDENGCCCHVGVNADVIPFLQEQFGELKDDEDKPLFRNWDGNQYALRLSLGTDVFVMAVVN